MKATGMFFVYRKTLLRIIDFLITIAIALLFLLVLFPGQTKLDLPDALLHGVVMVICVLTARLAAGVYRVTWRYSYAMNFLVLILSDMAAGIAFLAIERLVIDRFFSNIHIPIYLMMLMVMFSLLASMGIRLIYQINHFAKARKRGRAVELKETDTPIKTAIIGAGRKGAILADMLRESDSPRYDVRGFFDDDPELVGNLLRGIRIYKIDAKTPEMMAEMKVSEIIIASEPMSVEVKERFFNLFGKLGIRIRIYESPFDNTADKDGHKIRDLHIEDLLFRDPIVINDEQFSSYYSGKKVLITGAGGSIGSELCRQVAKLSPAKLIMLDIYENGVYDIQQELYNNYRGELPVDVEIASVRDADKVNRIFAKHKPDIVFHAAAHKHVPLMENCCDEAIKNNVFGTLNVVNAAEKSGVGKFITISTDKAVNPTNVMGATKRLCEMIIQSKVNSKTDFMAVRFGNVLGSNGSVIPLFKRQIEKGGPVTITDKRIIRYFMTIPEAAQLVMEAGARASKGDVYVLDMGKPVKVMTLAENMIKLAGYKPNVDIEIREIGLRPGEKLYEELLTKSGNLTKTENDLIFIEKASPITEEELAKKLEILEKSLNNDNDAIRRAVSLVVPTFCDAEKLNRKAAETKEMQSVQSEVK